MLDYTRLRGGRVYLESMYRGLRKREKGRHETAGGSLLQRRTRASTIRSVEAIIT
jgi:hypothetical protein